MTKTITIDDVKLEEIFFEDSAEFELVESEDWVAEGKYQYADIIFKDAEGDYFRGTVTRSGSPFSDYEYASDLYNETHTLTALKKVKRVVEHVMYVIEPAEGDVVIEG